VAIAPQQLTLPPAGLQPPKDDYASMFNGMRGTPAEEIKAEENLRIVILGQPKTGKSWFAATAPKPIAYYDFDRRASSLAGKAGVFVTTLFDSTVEKPTAMGDLEKELSMWQMKKAKGEPIPATFVLDSVTYMKQCMENELMKQDASLSRIVRVGTGKMVKIPSGWDVINAVQRYLQYWVTEFSALGNIILVFHERDEKDRDKSTLTETKYTGRVTVDPQYLDKILSQFNEVFRIEVDGQRKYTVSCRPNNNVLASTTLLIDAMEPPDLMAMLAKHKANKAKKL
jgi:hypothetical protein